MRKGLWSPDEDERLVRCITKYVNGSWSDIARKAGLDRCGKSCRRRWMNHLRPDLKRGKFSMDEINLIVKLQEALGNRWSDIASHLEGRTDNDVKNLWNTQIKKRLSQLKAKSSSTSVPMNITFNSSSNTHAAVGCSTMINNITDPSSLEFLQSMDHDLGNSNLLLRFGSLNGVEYSCSASSCDGSDQLSHFNDQENSSWKPTILSHSSLPADITPLHAASDSVDLFWSNMQDHDHHSPAALFSTESRADQSLLKRSCSSSNNVSLMIPGFLQQPHCQLTLLPSANNDQAASATALPHRDTLFHLYHENHEACTTTIASLESSSYVHVKANSYAGAVTDDSEECCSLIGSSMDHAPSLHDQMMIKNEINTISDLFSPAVDTITDNPLSKVVHNYNTDQTLLQKYYCSSSNENVAMSMNDKTYKDVDDSVISRVNDQPAAAKSEPAGAAETDQVMWEGPSAELPQFQGSMLGSVNIGWDMNECSMAHFSLPDWCKHLLQSDLL